MQNQSNSLITFDTIKNRSKRFDYSFVDYLFSNLLADICFTWLRDGRDFSGTEGGIFKIVNGLNPGVVS